MRIQIRAREIKVTKALRAHVELRIGFALSRFDAHIGRVTVDFATVAEASAGKTKLCRIVVGLRRAVKVEEIDADLYAAVDRAAVQAARAVAREVEGDDKASGSAPQPVSTKRTKEPAMWPLAARRKGEIRRLLALRRKKDAGPSRRLRSPQGA